MVSARGCGSGDEGVGLWGLGCGTVESVQMCDALDERHLGGTGLSPVLGPPEGTCKVGARCCTGS
eukprot:717706-Rhodomonas_salina.2